MKSSHVILLISIGLVFFLAFGCVDIPHGVTIFALHNGSNTTNISYAGPANHSLFFNMSRYPFMYYNSNPSEIVFLSGYVMCGLNSGGSFPSNITINYPQFGGAMLHAGQLAGYTAINDSGALGNLLDVSAHPLQGAERTDSNKLVQRFPLIHLQNTPVEFALWNNTGMFMGSTTPALRATCQGRWSACRHGGMPPMAPPPYSFSPARAISRTGCTL